MSLSFSPAMWSKVIFAALLLVAVAAVAVADVCLKRAAQAGSIELALCSPWLWAAGGLYLLQLGLFVVVFTSGWKLSVVGLAQTALYAVVTLGAGVVLFGEVLSPKQVLGLLLAVVGVVLLSL